MGRVALSLEFLDGLTEQERGSIDNLRSLLSTVVALGEKTKESSSPSNECENYLNQPEENQYVGGLTVNTKIKACGS